MTQFKTSARTLTLTSILALLTPVLAQTAPGQTAPTMTAAPAMQMEGVRASARHAAPGRPARHPADRADRPDALHLRQGRARSERL